MAMSSSDVGDEGIDPFIGIIYSMARWYRSVIFDLLTVLMVCFV
jgi:hypothetical protein